MKRCFAIFVMVIAFFAVTDLSVEASAGAIEHVRGRFLLDVDQRGEMWYVHPVSGTRFGVTTPRDALNIMQNFGLGITDADLERIPDADDAFSLPRSLRHTVGRILIRVQGGGEAWYVNPETGRRHRLGEPDNAWNVMASMALGIRHSDLERVPQALFASRTAYQAAPFSVQAPYAEWDDLRQGEGCEEAVALMAVRWARGQGITRSDAKKNIVAASDYELKRLGLYEDTSVEDTAEHILLGYFGFGSFEVRHGITVADIAAELAKGRVVMVPVEGRALLNPFFPGGDPFRHMILVIGYDANNDQFVAHDPGTRYGQNYRYSPSVLQDALLDYPSGYREPIIQHRTGMIAVRRE